MKRILLYGAAGGVLIAALQFIEYLHFVRAYPGEVYGGLVALIFTAVGAYVGLKWTRAREVVVVKEVRVRESGPRLREARGLAPDAGGPGGPAVEADSLNSGSTNG